MIPLSRLVATTIWPSRWSTWSLPCRHARSRVRPGEYARAGNAAWVPAGLRAMGCSGAVSATSGRMGTARASGWATLNACAWPAVLVVVVQASRATAIGRTMNGRDTGFCPTSAPAAGR